MGMHKWIWVVVRENFPGSGVGGVCYLKLEEVECFLELK